MDAIREQLTQEGHSGIPTKNGRMFDILQEYSVIIPDGDKAIWSATIEGEDWSNDLTLIKVATNKIWAKPDQRPNDFEGNIVAAEIKVLEDKEEERIEEVINHQPQEHESTLAKTERVKIFNEINSDNSSLEKIEHIPISQQKQDVPTHRDDEDLLTLLPSINSENNGFDDSVSDKIKNKIDVNDSKELILTKAVNYEKPIDLPDYVEASANLIQRCTL